MDTNIPMNSTLAFNELPIWPNSTAYPTQVIANASTAAAAMSKTNIATMFYVNTVAGGTLSVFGILGNIMVVTVLTLDRPVTSTSIMLRGLAISDSLFLITTFLYKPMLGIYFHLGQASFYAKYAYTCLIQYLRPIMYSLQHISTWIVVIVAVDRYFAVCRPLQNLSRRHTVRTRPRLTVLGIFIACLAFNIPRFFEYETKLVTYKNKTMCSPKANPSVKENKYYIIIYCWTLYFLLMYIIPIVTVTVINIKLILSLRQARKQSASLRGREPSALREDNTTRLLIIVVLVFIGCQTPDFILQFLHFINVIHPLDIKLGVFSKVTDMLLTFNAAINFIIYCAIGTNFRKTLTKLLRCDIKSSKRDAKFFIRLKLASKESTTSTNLPSSPTSKRQVGSKKDSSNSFSSLYSSNRHK